ncbi:hypothetical protein MLD38_024112 [Melastoma candidum]|uniref:Uncharacterized protein n=1 Tax=Melastoma candidum TaxID=119954 RepID=A0ACB9NSV9_9MYRT|nr:hypothetical protein MLD38_024112 [Melastoma candidum]
MPVLNKVSPRVEIDTSPPFASVKEAVTHFEGTGFRPPFRPLRFSPAFDVGEVDLKSVEEQALELEKNLIMKELETLDVLEELGTTKRIVEGLKWQLQKEALRCTATAPEAEEHNLRASPGGIISGDAQCRMQSQELILMELNQARSNLGKTIGELGVIQTSVESLNKRIKREKEILEKTRLRLTSKTSEVMVSPLKPQPNHDDATMFDQSKCTIGINASEMKLVAARKMEAAARAAEAVAMAEIKASSRNEASFNIYLPEPDNLIPFHQRSSPTSTPGWNLEEALTQNNRGKRNPLRSEILKKLEDATEEVKLSQQALEEALSRVDIANRKQIEAGEALRRWIPKRGDNHKNPYLANPMFPLDHHMRSPATDIVRTNIDDDEPKPVLRTTVSMRDMLGRKLILPEEYVARRQTEGRRVALSQMLNELREDLTFPPKSNRASQDQRKQFLAQRKKFGFMHITLPLTKQSKKNVHASDLR